MALRDDSVYEKLIQITTPYLGPSTERFVDRQIRNHLGIEPEKLKKSEVRELIDWMRLSMSLLTDNNDMVRDFIKELKTLGGISSAKA